MPIHVIIGGDVCILPPHTDKDLIPEKTVSFFQNSDLNIVNLECPIIDAEEEDKIVKTGPHLSTTVKVLNHLKKLNIHAVTLANNHIADYGENGIVNTLEACKEEGIVPVGAGRNIEEAAEVAVVDVKGKKIALVNFCENEWSTATDKTAGANPYDLINNLNQIREARRKADFVLVIIHGGHEIYNLPSPRMIKHYRFFAENGADAVINHHPHCISGYEIHGETPVIYSLGNMLFTKKTAHKGWNTGLLVSLKLEEGKPAQFELVPTAQTDDFQLTLPEGKTKLQILEEAEYYSGIITDKKKLEMHWAEYTHRKKRTLNIFSPLYILPWKFPNIFYRMGLNKLFLRKKNVSQMLNHIKCEAHRDVIMSLLSEKLQGNKILYNQRKSNWRL